MKSTGILIKKQDVVLNTHANLQTELASSAKLKNESPVPAPQKTKACFDSISEERIENGKPAHWLMNARIS